MSTISLRQANPADWPAIQTLLQANALPLDGAREHLSTFVVATSGPDVVGCAGAELRADVALLRSVAVAPGLHRQGIGRQMVSLVLQEAGGATSGPSTCSPPRPATTSGAWASRRRTAPAPRPPCSSRPSSRAPARRARTSWC
jgi:GNAT superfamily N-acetyltransferase